MNYEWLGIASDSLQIIMLAVICVLFFRKLDRGKAFLPSVFFLFGMAAFLLSDLYWLIHDFIRPDFRFPYSASEVSADGSFLLLAAVLVTLLGRCRDPMPWLTLGTIVFTLANIALWIAYSGEWFKDIFDGAIWLYFLYVIIRSTRRTGGFSRGEWIGMTLASAGYVVFNTLILLGPDAMKQSMNIANYATLYGAILFLHWKTFRSLKEDVTSPLRSLCLAYTGFAWSLLSMYMSSEPIYFVGMLSCTVMMALMYVSMERVVAQA